MRPRGECRGEGGRLILTPDQIAAESRRRILSKHNHHHCQHTMAYCDHCDTAYCTKCDAEWKKPCTLNHYPYTFSYSQPAKPWPTWYYGVSNTSAINTSKGATNMIAVDPRPADAPHPIACSHGR